MEIHVVQSGDTLWEIARQYGVPVDQIITANALDNPDNLVVGMALVIPTNVQPPFPVSKPVIDVNAYTLNTGETGVNEIHEVGQYLTYWMPFAYSMQEDGSLNTLDDTDMIQAAEAERVVPVLCIDKF